MDGRAQLVFGALLPFGLMLIATARHGVIPAERRQSFNQIPAGMTRAHGATEQEATRQAAEGGDASAQFTFGQMFHEGAGVARDDAQAVEWYRKAAEQGLAEAQFSLAWAYDNGAGVPQDYGLAARWYRTAAEQGVAGPQNNLAVMYADGHGVRQDYAQAARWFRKAAEQGLADAQHDLGVLYFKGLGVPKDFVEAHKWESLAAARARGDAQKLDATARDVIAENMTADELAEARRRARDWMEAFEQRAQLPARPPRP
jgi:TPR repeat protein